MLTIISTLTFLVFGSFYPLYLWIVAREEKMERGFYRLTLGLSSVIGAIGVFFFWLLDMDNYNRLSAIIWLISLIAVTQFYWNRSRIHPWVISIPSIFGAIILGRLEAKLIAPDYSLWIISFIGGFILCGAIFSMVLGHWYLNIVTLPIKLLRKSVKVLLFFLGVRIVWDLIFVFVGSIDFNGESILVMDFLQLYSGFFLFVAIIFGTIIPILLCIFTLRTITIHSIQSATGLLYVVVISVIMGDLFYKYHLLQLGLFL